MSAGYEKAIRSPNGVPHAQVVFDPFHVCQLGSKATDQVRRAEYNQHGRWRHNISELAHQRTRTGWAQANCRLEQHPTAARRVRLRGYGKNGFMVRRKLAGGFCLSSASCSLHS